MAVRVAVFLAVLAAALRQAEEDCATGLAEDSRPPKYWAALLAALALPQAVQSYALPSAPLSSRPEHRPRAAVALDMPQKLWPGPGGEVAGRLPWFGREAWTEAALGSPLEYRARLPEADRRYLDLSPTELVGAWAEPAGAPLLADLAHLAAEAPALGPDLDDHDGTPIGAGDSIGVVAATVDLDPAALPPALRVGLFAAPGAYRAVLRLSHTNAGDENLLRAALKLSNPEGDEDLADLHFTETLQAFVMKDREDLAAFAYSRAHGVPRALLKYPVQMARMGYRQYQFQKKYAAEVQSTGALGKHYYSLTPYKLGDTIMKFRLRPREARLPPGGADYRSAMRAQFTGDVAARATGFDLEVQVASDPARHPVNDASVEWDAPWLTVGAVDIPQQAFPDDLTSGSAVGSGLWPGRAPPRVTADFNSKRFFFDPGAGPHPPVGDIGAFRAWFYPKYDAVRQRRLVGTERPPMKCPFGFGR